MVELAVDGVEVTAGAVDGHLENVAVKALKVNEVEAVELLLENDASLILRNNENQTAFEIAQSKESFDVVTVLQKR